MKMIAILQVYKQNDQYKVHCGYTSTPMQLLYIKLYGLDSTGDKDNRLEVAV